MREEARKKKVEEIARKKAEREAAKAAKEAEKIARQAAKAAAKGAARKVSERKQTRAGNKRKASGRESGLLRRNEVMLIFTDVCCVCFGSYEDDAGTDREWLQCRCGRWIHEDCVDYEDSSPEGGLCPLC